MENFSYFCKVFNVIARKTLLNYCTQYPEAATALQEWYHEIIKLDSENFNQLKQVHRSVSIVGDDRVVFNIKGNKFRLLVRIVFDFKVIQIKWFGTHHEYDELDMVSIKYKRK